MLRGNADHNSILDRPHVHTITDTIQQELSDAAPGDADWKEFIETRVLANLTSKVEKLIEAQPIEISAFEKRPTKRPRYQALKADKTMEMDYPTNRVAVLSAQGRVSLAFQVTNRR